MDRSGFEARVRALWPGMVRLARCVVSDQADAEDAAAQAVLNCYRRLSSLRREEAFDDWPDQPAGEREGPELTPFLMRLPPKERLALELMYFENYPLEQIAAVLGVPRGTAASRLSRGRRRLRAIIEKEGLL